MHVFFKEQPINVTDVRPRSGLLLSGSVFTIEGQNLDMVMGEITVNIANTTCHIRRYETFLEKSIYNITGKRHLILLLWSIRTSLKFSKEREYSLRVIYIFDCQENTLTLRILAALVERLMCIHL